ncbi:WhiB family transcriptional regulator [Bifidobacterium imperatoris]|uniref:WhiB family transcriptional regulator n=1 Tax=Bifidobacterium imperatoris TaxID=2020965 RepID=A0A2N5ISL9_9BIFI|nr:WhiB family transcriptional regulator [Bifidobacterium imperatoris]PLS24968.1 WhiB family transcriptional regulator [Bifidobacterium imperatoris]QSY58607.1 WhiB family transcriptional regulator [Bifidobacterium imperatoris]
MTDWRHQATCRQYDPELWFSTRPDETKTALAVCRQCPVIDECRQFADHNNRINGYPLQGIWGGRRYGTGRSKKGLS